MRLVALTVVAIVMASCGDTTAGKLCQPGSDVCGDGFQCLTFCDRESGPQSICTPSFGAEAGETFPDEALIDNKVSFGELGNVRRFEKDLRIEIKGVKGVALPLLEEVVGNLSVVGTDIECLSLPRLNSVGLTFTIDLNEKLEKNDLASLETAGGLIVTDNKLVSEMLLTSATSFAGDVLINRNEQLEFVNLESLESIGGTFQMTGNAPREDSLHLDVLATVGCVDVAYREGGCAVPSALPGDEFACCAQDKLRRADCAACP